MASLFIYERAIPQTTVTLSNCEACRIAENAQSRYLGAIMSGEKNSKLPVSQ